MEKLKLNFDKYKTPPKKKAPTYEWQEICLEIHTITGVHKGICFKLWNVHGWGIRRILGEIKAGEIPNPQAYLRWLLKNDLKND